MLIIIIIFFFFVQKLHQCIVGGPNWLILPISGVIKGRIGYQCGYQIPDIGQQYFWLGQLVPAAI